MSGKYINTVCGQISPEELGFTLMHEHVIVDPQIDDEKYDNYRLLNEDLMIQEIREFVKDHGNTILDAAPLNFGRDVEKMELISKQTGCNILFTTGFHKELFMPDYVKDKSVDELSEIIISEIINGVGPNKRKPAVIKFGTSLNEITKYEEKCIEAVCIAHRKTQTPIITHTEKGTAGLKQIQQLKRNGVNSQNVILGHLDLKLDIDYYREMLDEGANIQFDHFGRGELNEESRLEILKKLIEGGYINQLFISGDMGKKEYLLSYGGKPGFRYFVSDLKKKFINKISEKDYNHIMIENVKTFFKRQL